MIVLLTLLPLLASAELALDGVYECRGENDAPAFVRAPTPTPEQLQRLLERTARRIRALVARAPPAPEPEEMQAPLLKVLGAEPVEPKLVAQFDGFNLHAGARFESRERVALVPPRLARPTRPRPPLGAN